ncbi:hypothetical protein [Streptomyces sp. NPDC017964]|uniref:hypothetical protein n=1 Tax=Streptomyces sp. NPDC017964 TaxID=3365022 RepID=UPI0037A2ECB0
MGVVFTAAATPAVGYLLGLLRLWRRLDDRAADQVRLFTGVWVRGGFGRQAVVVWSTSSPRRAPASCIEHERC